MYVFCKHEKQKQGVLHSCQKCAVFQHDPAFRWSVQLPVFLSHLTLYFRNIMISAMVYFSHTNETITRDAC